MNPSGPLARVLRSLLGGLVRGAGEAMRDQARGTAGSRTHGDRRRASRETGEPHVERTGSAPGGPRPLGGAYPGDFHGVPPMAYAPRRDDRPDPGEVVWAWVPFEEDHAKGKDRPVLLVGRDGDWLLGLPLTSKDHDRDAEQERRAGRLWTDLGPGPWDASGRASEVRLNRVIRVDPAAVRRDGGRVDQGTFDRVADEVRAALS